MKRVILSFFICFTYLLHTTAQIGTWKVYPSYNNITDIIPNGNKIYVLASGALFVYDKTDNSIQTFDKSNLLNDVDITHIAYNKVAKQFVIIYKNSNIDLLNLQNKVTNIPNIYLHSMTVDKNINHIYIYQQYAYLSTPFGIIKLNVRNAEISDTYMLGFNVDWTHIENGKIIAESLSKGKYSADLNVNLLDKNNWKRIGNYTPLHKNIDKELKNNMEKYRPIGPKYNHFYYMLFDNNKLYTTAGGFESGSIDLDHPGTVQVFNNEQWQIYQDSIDKITGYSYVDNNCIAIDPNNTKHVFAGGRTGLYEFLEGKLIKYYNKDNSILGGAIDRGKELDNNYVLITGLAFDQQSHLWILNSQTNKETLIELTPEGKMISHNQKELIPNGNGLSCMANAMFDSRQLLWFTNKHSGLPGLFCYQPNKNKLHAITKFVNQDGINISVLSVKCVAEDLENNIWIGTNIGPLMLPAAQIPLLNNTTFNQIKITRKDDSNLADYLLSGVNISCIAIDKANRKWFGTVGNGIYVMSADNQTQIHHFTTHNSTLISDDIESIAINHLTGEVFIGSDKGLCSYHSEVIQATDTMNKELTYAYPNPVEPNYNGYITIVGLTYNADIKIVTTSGTLVKKGKSSGGSFVWDGNDLNGKPVASGIYMVQTADQEGNKGTVCKIVIIR